MVKFLAKKWFRDINNLDKDKIKKLKKFLDGYTLLGQYCGNLDSQGLVFYKEPKIIWSAMVDNFSDQYCMDPFQVRKDI